MYKTAIDLSAPTIRCNCSICTKARSWIAPVPVDNFSLLQGECAYAEYQFGACTITHCFCKTCGVRTHGRIKDDKGYETLVGVCVNTLDLSPDEFATFDITYVDGRADRKDTSPRVTSYL